MMIHEAFVWRIPSRRRHDHKKNTLCRFHTPIPHHGNGGAPMKGIAVALPKKPKQASGYQTHSE